MIEPDPLRIVRDFARAAPEPEADRFGEMAVERGYIGRDQLESALDEQRRSPTPAGRMPLGQILLRRQWINVDQFVTLLKAQVDQPAPKTRIGKYEVVRELGRGGMGVVYEGIDPDLRRRVALKVLKTDDTGSRDLARWQREATLAARLRHPNIIAVHEVGVMPDESGIERHVLVMDFVEGRTLAEVAPELSRRRRLEALESVARAVGAAHAQGIIHRDLKPQNVLIESAAPGKAYLADFGLAREQAANDLTRTGTVIGTPYYMAPEQVRGESDLIGPWTDVWALGVTMYELLTDRRPFEGKTPVEIYGRIVREDVVPPRSIRREIHADIETICMKALQGEPARRYRDAAAFADDLRRHLDDEPILARPPGIAERLARRFRRHPMVSGIVAAAAVLLIAATGLVIRQMVIAGDALRDLDAERHEKAQRRAAEDAMRPARVLLDRWELDRGELTAEQSLVVDEHLRKGGEIYPGLGSWTLEEGRALWMRGDLDGAERRFSQALDDPAVRFLGHYYRARIRLTRYARSFRPPAYMLGGMVTSERTSEGRLFDESPEIAALRRSALTDLDAMEKLVGVENRDARVLFGRALALRYGSIAGEDLLRAAEQLEACAGSGVVGPWEALYEAGLALAAAAHWPEAERVFRAALEAGRRDASLRAALGNAVVGRILTEGRGYARKAEELKEAIEHLDAAVELAPDDASIRALRGHALLERGRARVILGEDAMDEMTAAIADLEQVRRLEPGRARAYHDVGAAKYIFAALAHGFGRDAVPIMRECIESHGQALTLDPSFWPSYYARATVCRTLSEEDVEDREELLRGALKDINVFLERRSDAAPVWEARGSIKFNIVLLAKEPGETSFEVFQSAIDDFGRAIELDGGRPTVFVQRGRARLAMAIRFKNMADVSQILAWAYDDMTQAIERERGFAEAHYFRGMVAMERLMWREALEDLEEARRLKPIMSDDLAWAIDACRRNVESSTDF